MDDYGWLPDDAGIHPSLCGATVSTNTQYIASALDGVVYIYKLTSLDGHPLLIYHQGSHPKQKLVLALSPLHRNLLAVSDGAQVIIYDVTTTYPRYMLPGNGRTITSLAWSPLDPNALASGSIDGSICLWNLQNCGRWLYQLSFGGALCETIAFHPSDEDILISTHGGKLCIWSFISTSRPLKIILDEHVRFSGAMWYPTSSCGLITLISDIEFRLYDLTDILAHTAIVGGIDSENERFYMLDELNAPQEAPTLLCRHTFNHPITSMGYIGGSGILVLPKNGYEPTLYTIIKNETQLLKLWSCELDDSARVVQIRAAHDGAKLLAFGEADVECYDVPKAVLESLGPRGGPKSSMSSPSRTMNAENPSRLPKSEINMPKDNEFVMEPISISSQRPSGPHFTKTSKQILHRRLFAQKKKSLSPSSRGSKPSQSYAPSTPPPLPSIHSSLELPNPRREDTGSPMPFLSPNIPSRKPSPNGIPPLEEPINLSSLTKTSFDSSVSSTSTHDSDSDDETFADTMRGSGSFLPGGINVPLPKACGALFAPNGQLLCFFPPRPTLLLSKHGDSLLDQPKERRETATKFAGLFPTFSNWPRHQNPMTSDSDSDISSCSDDHISGMELQPSLSFQVSALPHEQSWKVKTSPTKLDFTHRREQHKIVVSIHDIQNVELLRPTQQKLAEKYHILCEEGECGADVCKRNASVAEQAKLNNLGVVWRLLGMLLEDKVPLGVLSEANGDAISVARRAKALSENATGFDDDLTGRNGGDYAKLRWADHPLGAAWLVRVLFRWAEQRADMQMLACMSAILAEAEQNVPNQEERMPQAWSTKMLTFSADYFTGAMMRTSSHAGIRPVPILRTDKATNTSFQESPVKLQRSSTASSRNASQPTTPHLESLSSTPPFAWPPLSRQNSRLSGSGSASPEYQRGSFSAAAKYYAQSITDKLASYGTSPPRKKLGTSPNSNELSTSLPSGSLSKSVSFASTAETTRGNQLSKSYDGPDDTDAYDSDKTVEDTSAPPTPKSPGDNITVTLKNQFVFSDEVSGCVKISLIPQDLKASCYAWQEYYAEQLRTWGLLAQAAELEKTSGVPSSGTLSGVRIERGGVIPRTHLEKHKPTCVICLVVARGTEQVCAHCLHASHLACLELYLTRVSQEGFTCPAGCGCICSELSHTVSAVDDTRPTGLKTSKKKASFTDPRRWRARLEGDSW